MKLHIAGLMLAAFIGCARVEQPGPGADRPLASTAPPRPTPTAEPRPSPFVPEAAPRASASHARLPSATSDEFPGTSVSNRDGLRGLLAALGDVDNVELVRWDRCAPAEPLSTADKTRLLELIRRGRLTDTHTVAHPPWPAAFLFHTRSHGSFATTLVGRANLRLDAGRPDGHFEGSAARWNSSPPPEMAVDQEGGWLWTYFETRLGPTREQEYLAPKAPPYLELPRRPNDVR
ncbi:MAG TPA: hypothetical protein VER11_18540 [Polyangiaceae bacterium]|nr:hypothetical protein [Polyangiaceae bacterium]